MSTSADSRKLQSLEADYRVALLAALEACAEGRWGLFGQNDVPLQSLGKYTRKRQELSAVADLLELGVLIDRLRLKLGHSEPFPLHARLVQLRSADRHNAVGEPELARQWLDELR